MYLYSRTYTYRWNYGVCVDWCKHMGSRLNDRHSQVLYDNDLKLFIVEMYKKTKDGMKKITTKPMNTEQLAENTAEDWVHMVLNYPLPKEYVNDN